MTKTETWDEWYNRLQRRPLKDQPWIFRNYRVVAWCTGALSFFFVYRTLITNIFGFSSGSVGPGIDPRSIKAYSTDFRYENAEEAAIRERIKQRDVYLAEKAYDERVKMLDSADGNIDSKDESNSH